MGHESQGQHPDLVIASPLVELVEPKGDELVETRMADMSRGLAVATLQLTDTTGCLLPEISNYLLALFPHYFVKVSLSNESNTTGIGRYRITNSSTDRFEGYLLVRLNPTGAKNPLSLDFERA